MNDTPMRIEKRYKVMLSSRTPSERLRMVSRMYDSGRKLVMSGIKKERQQLDTRQLRGQFFMRMYESDFTAADRDRIIKKIPNIKLDTDS
jgi:GTP cyclohydrolase I